MPNAQVTKQNRRKFLSLFPLTVVVGVFTSIAAAGFRFLRPRITQTGSENWTDVASVSELQGNLPVPKQIRTEHYAGWAITSEARKVFVLPAKGNQVLSAICPHEGCEVWWEKDSNQFSCPCHESYFAADGSTVRLRKCATVPRSSQSATAPLPCAPVLTSLTTSVGCS